MGHLGLTPWVIPNRCDAGLLRVPNGANTLLATGVMCTFVTLSGICPSRVLCCFSEPTWSRWRRSRHGIGGQHAREWQSMRRTRKKTASPGQFVGEIESEIAGRSHFQADVQLGEHINLERELENQRDKNAIRVDNSRFQPVGYVPRPTVAWLAPLLDSGKIRIEGYVPTHPHSIRTTDPERLPLAIMIHLTKAGLSILETTSWPCMRTDPSRCPGSQTPDHSLRVDEDPQGQKQTAGDSTDAGPTIPGVAWPVSKGRAGRERMSAEEGVGRRRLSGPSITCVEGQFVSRMRLDLHETVRSLFWIYLPFSWTAVPQQALLPTPVFWRTKRIGIISGR